MERRRTNEATNSVRRRRRCAAMRACKQSIRAPTTSLSMQAHSGSQAAATDRDKRAGKRRRHQFRSRGGDDRPQVPSVCWHVPHDATPTLNRKRQSPVQRPASSLATVGQSQSSTIFSDSGPPDRTGLLRMPSSKRPLNTKFRALPRR